MKQITSLFILTISTLCFSSSLNLQTGQTTSIQVYDDGHYKKGLSKNYLRYNNIVTDNVTKLMWEDGVVNSANKNNAIIYCNDLSLGGYTNWRLPTIKELSSLVDSSKTAPSINNIFKNTNSNLYISSSFYQYSSSAASMVVDFNEGYVHFGLDSTSYKIRCVRDLK